VNRREATGREAFTLVELIISVTVSVGVVSSAYLCLHAGLRSQATIERRVEIYQKARVALELLSADLRSACTLSEDVAFLGANKTLGNRPADHVDFATRNWTSRGSGEGDFCEVGYSVRTHPTTGKLSLLRRRDPSPEEQPLGGGETEEIITDVAGFDLEYYDGLQWYPEWGQLVGEQLDTGQDVGAFNLLGIPDAVQITLSFSSVEDSVEDIDGEVKPPDLLFRRVVFLNLARRGLPTAATSNSSRTPEAGAPSSSPGSSGGSRRQGI
jgi:hypothetical protein